MPLLRRRRERDTKVEGRATLMSLAADVFEEGDTPAQLKRKMKLEIENSDEPRPFKKILLTLLDALLPVLIKFLTGALSGLGAILLLVTVTMFYLFPLTCLAQQGDGVNLPQQVEIEKAAQGSAQPTTDFPLERTEQQMIADTNAFRARNGLPALEPAAWLMRLARQHTTVMVRARSMFHSSFGLRENVAMGQSNSAAVTSAWENSPGHRNNMASNSRYIGVAGYVDQSGTPYWTQVFADSPDGSAQAPTGGSGATGTDRKLSLPQPVRRILGRLRR